MRLTIGSGTDAGRAVDLTGVLVVGRDEGADLVVADEKVSRRHCRLTPQADGTVVVEDLGSSNGTFVDGERITRPVTLRGGEELRVGSTTLRVQAERAGAETVVGSPRTFVAPPPATAPLGLQPPEPPPQEPPAPPAPGGEDRPWWRSKWAAIGAAGAAVVIGGTVGGIVAATSGGGGGESAAAVTQPTVTVTQQETVTVPADTGAVAPETGVADDAGDAPSEAEAALLRHVPTEHGLQANCERDPDPPAKAVAGVACRSDTGSAAFYYQFETVDDMVAWYEQLVDETGATPDRGDCVEDDIAEGSWSVEGSEGGRLLCTASPDGASRLIFWTSADLAIGSAAAAPSDQPESRRVLYDLWSSSLGPS